MIYVTLGTMFMPFDRLVKKMDHIAANTGEQVIIQRGLSKIEPQYCEYFDFKSHEEVLEIQRNARVIVAHAGIGATMDALAVHKPLLLAPRLKRYDEHMNDHQLEIGAAMERRGWARMILEVEDLDAACTTPPVPPESYTPDKAGLVNALKGWVMNVAEGGGTA